MLDAKKKGFVDEKLTSSHDKTISQMAEIYSVTRRALRFYEDRGLLTPHRIGSHRFYSPRDEIRLQLIKRGKTFGLSLSQIHEMVLSKEQDRQYSGSLPLNKEQIIDQIAKLERRRAEVTDALEELYLACKN